MSNFEITSRSARRGACAALFATAFLACGGDGTAPAANGGAGGTTNSTGGSGGSTTPIGTGGTTTGSGGSGGSTAPDKLDVIDDFEEDDDAIAETNGRSGRWSSYDDASGGEISSFANVSIPGGRDSSTMGTEIAGKGLMSWGGAFEFSLNDGSSGRNTYDVSPYLGISFWARASDTSAVNAFQLLMKDKNTDPAGGLCMGTGKTSCYDNWAKNITLTKQWRYFRVLWKDFKQGGFGYAPANNKPDLANVFGFSFQVGANSGKAFDFWIDDVAFIQDPATNAVGAPTNGAIASPMGGNPDGGK